MSPTHELWNAIRDRLLAVPALMALIDEIYDKVPKNCWKGKNAYLSRGPAFGTDDGAECIDGQEITLQIDVWSKVNSRWSCDDIVDIVRKALHEQAIPLAESALVELWVDLWRVIDDPDPLVAHGIVQVRAMIEVPEED